MFIGDNGKHLFYTVTYIILAIMAYQFYRKARFWMQGRPTTANPPKTWKDWIPNWTAIKKWFVPVWTYVIEQKKIRSSRPKSGSPMHLLIFYGFVALTIGTTLLAINTYSPIKFHFGLYFEIYEITLDTMGLAFIVGVSWALVRRWLSNRQKSRRVMSHEWSDYWALALLLVVAVTGYWLEGARLSVWMAHGEWFRWFWVSPIGTLVGLMEGPYSPEMYRFVWWFHVFWIWLFFLTLPQMKLKHIVVAFGSSAGKPNVKMGRLEPLSIEDVEKTGKIGASEPFDFDRWHLLSLDACTECGRCTEVCPAWGVGKVLDPKEIVQGVRSAMYETKPLSEKITDEALWACTTCNACVEACPVLIKQVDLIVDMRRSLTAEGKLTGSGAAMLRQTASTGSAWGTSKSDREAWMEGLDVPLAREVKTFDVLLWIGCAGATDPHAIKTSRAMVSLLKKAGVNFACLGREEQCTGDPARRMGDEFLFQDMATGNIGMLQRYGVKKVITACPHCFNTFANEYGDFGIELEVQHHSQALAELTREGKLKPIEEGEVTFHDPCYLGRINDETTAPRSLFKIPVKEPEHHGAKTLCCGAGGGRMWMEESPDQRPATRRMGELEATGAKTVATGCPFCRIMLETGQTSGGSQPRLVDLALLMQEANASEQDAAGADSQP